jgi:hypothetical protein
LELAYFMNGLTDGQRDVARKAATAYYEMAKGFYAADALPAVEAAWAADLDHATRFGWPSPVFESLAPTKIFRDE